MKHIYIILLLLLSCNIYAQEKELDLQKLAELVNSDEEFNQYFEDLGWSHSPRGKSILYKTVWRDTITIKASKNDYSIWLFTDEPKLARHWRKQTSRFTELINTKDTIGEDSQIFQLPNTPIEYKSYFTRIKVINNGEEVYVNEYGLRVLDKEKLKNKEKIRVSVIQARPKNGMVYFRNKLLDEMKSKKFEDFDEFVIRFIVEEDGSIGTVLVFPEEAIKFEKEVKNFLAKEPKWYPAKDKEGDPVVTWQSIKIKVR